MRVNILCYDIFYLLLFLVPVCNVYWSKNFRKYTEYYTGTGTQAIGAFEIALGGRRRFAIPNRSDNLS